MTQLTSDGNQFLIGDANRSSPCSYSPVLGLEIAYKWGEAIETKIIYRCITCMREYEDRSFEEIRLEDYNAGRKGSPLPEFTGFKDKDVVSGTQNENIRGTGHVPFLPKVNVTEGTKGQSITLMEEYKNKSFEELRHEDYSENRKGVSLSARKLADLKEGSRVWPTLEELATQSEIFNKIYLMSIAKTDDGLSNKQDTPAAPPKQLLPWPPNDAFITNQPVVKFPDLKSLRYMGRGDMLLNEYLVKLKEIKRYQGDPASKMKLNVYAVMHIIGVDGSYVLKDNEDPSNEITVVPFEKKNEVKLLSELTLNTIFSTKFIGTLSKKLDHLTSIKSGLVLELRDKGIPADYQNDSAGNSGIISTDSGQSNNESTSNAASCDSGSRNEDCGSAIIDKPCNNVVISRIMTLNDNYNDNHCYVNDKNVEGNVGILEKNANVGSIDISVKANDSIDVIVEDDQDKNITDSHNDRSFNDKRIVKSVDRTNIVKFEYVNDKDTNSHNDTLCNNARTNNSVKNNNSINEKFEDFNDKNTKDLHNDKFFYDARIDKSVNKSSSSDEKLKNAKDTTDSHNDRSPNAERIGKSVENANSIDESFEDVNDKNTNDPFNNIKSVENSNSLTSGLNNLVFSFGVGVLIGLTSYHFILNWR